MAYLCLWVIWLVALWYLSAGNPAPKSAPQIPHLDKVAHFGYFLIGGGLLAFFGLMKWAAISRMRLFGVVWVIGAVIGRLDEYHQTFTPGRIGNDTGDWLADMLGTAFGAIVVIWFVMPELQRALVRSKNIAGKSQFVSNSLD